MDPAQSSTQQSASNLSSADIAGDLAHINQEMYKKNAELAQKNKTLSLLRKIDDLILNSVTDTHEIAQKVSDLLIIEAGFLVASIFLLDRQNNVLKRLGIAESETLKEGKKQSTLPEIIDLSLLSNTNTVVQVVKAGAKRTTTTLFDFALKPISDEKTAKLQNEAGIKTFLIYPLIVREETIGTMCIGASEEEKDLSTYQTDVLDRLVGVIGIALDNALLYNEVQLSNEKLKVIDKLKDEFVSLASHELRAPMTAVKSYMWMVLAGKGGVLTEKQKYYLDRAYKSTDRLIKLVNDMLDISRIESGKITVNFKRITLPELVQEVVEEVFPRARESGVMLKVRTVGTIPVVSADPDKIKEVLLNLIDNSLKFTQKGGNISITITSYKDTVEIEITDTGKGIDPADIPRLFQKFGLTSGSYVVSHTTMQGTGLGLYISKSIINLHQGKLRVYSEGHGKGATFTFNLPLSRHNTKEKLQTQRA